MEARRLRRVCAVRTPRGRHCPGGLTGAPPGSSAVRSLRRSPKSSDSVVRTSGDFAPSGHNWQSLIATRGDGRSNNDLGQTLDETEPLACPVFASFPSGLRKYCGRDFVTQPSSHTPSSPIEESRSLLVPAVAALVLAAHVPLLILLGQRMWNTEHYSFFPLILVGGGVIGWQRYERYKKEQTGPVWDMAFRSPLLWLISLALLALGVAAHSPWPVGVGFLLALRASINSLVTDELARRLMPAWWFLWLAIPLPFNFDRHLILMMQLLATKLASGVLDLGGIRHAVSGVIIELPGKSYFVEEACSGVQSLFAAISVTIFYSLLGERGLLRTVLLSIIGIGWVLAANALRIIVVTIASSRYQIPLDVGWAHEATGAAVFVLALLMIVSTDRLLLFLAPLRVPSGLDTRGGSGYFGESKGYFSTSRGYFSTSKGGSSTKGTRERFRLSPVLTIPVAAVAAAAFGFLGWVQLTHAVTSDPGHFILERGEEIVTEATLPEEWNGWKKTGFTIIERERNDPNGQISRVWQYQRSGQSVSFSLDGPFTVWHDLGNCYTSQGWTVGKEEDFTTATDTGTRYDYSEISQENMEGRHAFVAFTAFDQTGERVSPPPFFRVGVGMRFPDAVIVMQQFKDLVTNSENPEKYSGIVYQSQAYVEAQSLLTAAERSLVVELFQHLTGQLRQEFERHAIFATAESED
jgi:exosortase